jgi:hypothetical protein
MSERFNLNVIDWKKIGRGALIWIAWFLFTYFESEVFPMIDWGTYAPIAVAINGVIVNIVTKRLSWPKA